jgi:hypothetical protein
MSVLLESKQRRLLPPEKVFAGHCRHACYGVHDDGTPCDNVLVVPTETPGCGERLEEGDIWACNKCGTLHEYYMAYAGGSRWATIRVLRGPHRRDKGEPRILEFVL